MASKFCLSKMKTLSNLIDLHTYIVTPTIQRGKQRQLISIYYGSDTPLCMHPRWFFSYSPFIEHYQFGRPMFAMKDLFRYFHTFSLNTIIHPL